MWLEFAEIKGAKIILHAKSSTFRAAKLKGFTVCVHIFIPNQLGKLLSCSWIYNAMPIIHQYIRNLVSCNNYVHITQAKRKIIYLIATFRSNFIRRGHVTLLNTWPKYGHRFTNTCELYYNNNKINNAKNIRTACNYSLYGFNLHSCS